MCGGEISANHQTCQIARSSKERETSQGVVKECGDMGWRKEAANHKTRILVASLSRTWLKHMNSH